MTGTTHDLVFYDGSCGLCHHAVRFLVARDADGHRFVYAPLGGETFRERLEGEATRDLPDSIVLLAADGSVLIRSQAALRLLGRLGGGWRVLAAALRLIPTGLADFAYDLIARIRYRLFARPRESCPVLPAPLRTRFLP